MRGDGRAANRIVSTHSRPKAAGAVMMFVRDSCNGFNSQPPEGGWVDDLRHWLYSVSFNSQPPEGGWYSDDGAPIEVVAVSTHSRPKAAGTTTARLSILKPRFNSQPPEGGWNRAYAHRASRARFNSQPPEGGWRGLLHA